jgi:hypothetical protein
MNNDERIIKNDIQLDLISSLFLTNRETIEKIINRMYKYHLDPKNAYSLCIDECSTPHFPTFVKHINMEVFKQLVDKLNFFDRKFNEADLQDWLNNGYLTFTHNCWISDCVVRVNKERLKRDGYDIEFVDELAELAENITSFSDDEEE